MRGLPVDVPVGEGHVAPPGPRGPALPAPERSGRLTRVARALEPVTVYLAVRAVGLLVLVALGSARGVEVAEALHSWDGAWLLGIAEHGYGGLPPGEFADARGEFSAETPYGFFPGYPLAVAGLGLLGLGPVTAGLLVTLIAGVALAYGLLRLAEAVPGGSRRAGLVLVGLVAASPMAVVFSMTYTEALFCALAAWTLVFTVREAPLRAGLCCAAAGLVRPTAFALVAALATAAIVAFVVRRRPWPAVAGTAIGLAGVGGWMLAVAVVTGAPGGWQGIQERGWGWTFDSGLGTARWLAAVVVDGTSVYELCVVAVLLGSLALLGVLVAAAVRSRLPWPLVVYGAAVVGLAVGSNGLMFMKARFLLPAFVLLLPPALALAKRRTGTVALVVIAATLGSAWLGAQALTVWSNAL